MHRRPDSNSGGPASLLLESATSTLKRRREWNREPLRDLFPRIPATALEEVLDLCISKNFTYNLSEGKFHNARRYSSLVVAYVRHNFSDYDCLLDQDAGLDRFEARRRVADRMWEVLKEWCPWESSNEVLERCFQATLLRREEREPGWDPMDIDSDSDVEEVRGSRQTQQMEAVDTEAIDDPMDID